MAGHFQPPVSRRTTAIVDIHCMAKAKKINSATAPPGVSSLCSRWRRPTDWSPVSSTPYMVPSVPTITSRGQGADQPNPNLPIEAERLNGRFHSVANHAGEAMLDFRRLAIVERQMQQNPKHQRDGQNHRSSAAQKN